MLRSAASKVMWVGRATVFTVGLAMIIALVLGVASTALAGNLDPLKLGTAKNVATKVTTMVGKVATGSSLVVKNPSGGPALGLEANAGQAPVTVNAEAGTATNLSADKLDGRDSTQFIEGSGKIQSYAATGGPGNYITPYFEGGFFRVAYLCPSPLTNNGHVFFRNLAGEQINLFFDNGSTNPTYIQLANDETYQPPANPSGEFVTYQVHSPTHGVAAISVMTVHRDGNCHVQAQAVVDK
jgi:hypothetical protein